MIGITKNYYQFVADFNNTGNILFASVADITNEESKVYSFPHNLKKILRSRKKDMIHWENLFLKSKTSPIVDAFASSFQANTVNKFSTRNCITNLPLF